ncbi:MAG: hypothetical protein P8K78_10390 [Pirellulales bacterium]|nr:hypothetical protein [Pirellulales bacterium]
MALHRILNEVSDMRRALLLAIGLFICFIGLECMFVETAFITTADFAQIDSSRSHRGTNIFAISPPDWAPWGLFISGGVVMLYSLTISRTASR